MGKETRTCHICGKTITEGYFCEDDGTWYCSDECLHVEVSEEKYDKYYEEGVMFWTEL